MDTATYLVFSGLAEVMILAGSPVLVFWLMSQMVRGFMYLRGDGDEYSFLRAAQRDNRIPVRRK